MPASLPHELEPVAKLLEKDEPKVLAVVGAGISIGATGEDHASWLGLLKHGVRYLADSEVFTEKQWKKLDTSLDAAFSHFGLDTALEHAELVERNLTTPDHQAFARWLHAAFANFKERPGGSDVLDALRALEQAGALLLTTNYDSVLSDATGLPAVTWEEHADFYAVTRRHQRGILHVHGHWQRPSSIVLGRSSYQRIVDDAVFQNLLKFLWLERSWLYVGCGDGLGDPNLGRLLHWTRWAKETPSDYFLAKRDVAFALATRVDKPANLVCVDYADHSDLGGVLQALAPDARCWPFTRVDDDFALFRSPTSAIPFPSRREYLEGAVPALEAEAEVRRRFDTHGWAFLLGVASVGKTTLALRLATAHPVRPAFYLDLATMDADEIQGDIRAALERLSRRDALLIVDNVHYQPELARQLWDQWRERPGGSNLLMVATRTDRAVTTAPAQDLSFFEHHVTNPAVEPRTTQRDLAAIVHHLYQRVAGPHARALAMPPPEVLETWHRDYGSALAAFCIAVLSRLAEFERHDWDLPLHAAADWVREKWLRHLDAEDTENVLCLAVHGAQDLELLVQHDALPHPEKVSPLLSLGLIAKVEVGKFGQYRRYILREPGWGGLLLAAFPKVDYERILFETAARHPSAAILLSNRLRGKHSIERLERVWAFLADSPQQLLRLLSDTQVSYLPNLAKMAAHARQPALARQLWNTVGQHTDAVVRQLWQMKPNAMADFLVAAKKNRQDTSALWDGIEREPERLHARIVESLDQIGSFLKVARWQGRNHVRLWEIIESNPEKLAGHLEQVGLREALAFINTAKQQGRDVKVYWQAIEREPDKLMERLWETGLDGVAWFFDTAAGHDRDVAALWQAFERQPARVAERAMQSTLDSVAAFLNGVKRYGRDPHPFWDAIESESEKFLARAWETPLEHLASFLNIAKAHGRKTDSWWQAIEGEPERFAQRGWATSMEHLAHFLAVAKRHGRDPSVLWDALESDLDQLAACAWATPLAHVGAFMAVALHQQRNTGILWAALQHDQLRVARTVQAASVHDVVSFLNTAAAQELDTSVWWAALERDPAMFAGHALRISDMAFLLRAVEEHGRDSALWWSALEGDSQRLTRRASEARLGEFASLVRAAKKAGHDAALWATLERDPRRFAELVGQASISELATFLEITAEPGRDIALLWSVLESDPEGLAERILATPLHFVARFFNTVQHHRRDIRWLLEAMEKRGEQLARIALRIPSVHLSGFCRYAPDGIARLALSGFATTHWDKTPPTESMAGAVSLAMRCAEVGREDLRDALTTLLLRRKDWRDFPAHGQALASVASLLNMVPARGKPLVNGFVREVCKAKWLLWQFSAAGCGALASGLRMLAFQQPPEIRDVFVSAGMSIRLRKELWRFNALTSEDQGTVIQLLGSASLWGFRAKLEWLANVSLNVVATLPVEVLPHAGDARKVDEWQYQLWLGLRALTGSTGKALAIPPAIFLRTLQLWRANAEETSTAPQSMEHMTNLSMVRWLERSLCTHAAAKRRA